MQAIIYRRVSTEEQAESGLGLDAQLHTCQRAADSMGAPLVGPFTEDISGAAGLDKRPELLRAIAALRKGDVLLVAKRDRLSRGEPMLMAMIESAVRRKKARIVSVAGEGTENDDPSSILFRRMVDAFAEYERLIIGARTSSALQAKIRRGERAGQIPFGHDLTADGKNLVVNSQEQEAIALMKRLRAEGATFQAIADELTRRGIFTKERATWQPITVSRIIKRAA
jgi:DNA invertase Pin-like site-specific DNA recombinase